MPDQFLSWPRPCVQNPPIEWIQALLVGITPHCTDAEWSRAVDALQDASDDNVQSDPRDSGNEGGEDEYDDDYDDDDEWEEPEYDENVGITWIEDPDEDGLFDDADWCEEC